MCWRFLVLLLQCLLTVFRKEGHARVYVGLEILGYEAVENRSAYETPKRMSSNIRLITRPTRSLFLPLPLLD